jgi:hypothetical protein
MVVFLLSLAATSVAAQEETPVLKLGLNRDFGYGGRGEIQGTFTARVSGVDNLQRVIFYIDEQVMGEVTEAPFSLRFHTDNYEQGAHVLYAVGTTSDGQELRSNEIRTRFVSAEQGWQAAMTFLVPVLVIAGLAMVVPFITSALGGKKLSTLPPGAPRKYGAAGGAICPKCGRPFSRNFLSPNMLVGKLERCPFCGKISIVPAASAEALRAAEQAELADAQNQGLQSAVSEEERLRRDLEKSRFDDV